MVVGCCSGGCCGCSGCGCCGRGVESTSRALLPIEINEALDCEFWPVFEEVNGNNPEYHNPPSVVMINVINNAVAFILDG